MVCPNRMTTLEVVVSERISKLGGAGAVAIILPKRAANELREAIDLMTVALDHAEREDLREPDAPAFAFPEPDPVTPVVGCTHPMTTNDTMPVRCIACGEIVGRPSNA